MNEEKKCPIVPKELLDHLKEIYDIRQMVMYTTTREELLGIQEVINFLEYNYREQNKLDEQEDVE